VVAVAYLEARMGFKENLVRLREGKDWTQAETAQAAGVPYRTYQNWENGNRQPGMGNLISLAKAFGVSLDELTAGEDPEFPPAPVPEPPARAVGKRK
jgi:transcriptional regulator with XRE-family HTH domain